MDRIGAVASSCFAHPTLSLASGQALKDLKRSQGHQRGGEERDLANGVLRTSPKFTIGFLIRSEIRKSQSPFASQPLEHVVILDFLLYVVFETSSSCQQT